MEFISYKAFSVRFDPAENTFDVLYEGLGEIVRGARIASIMQSDGSFVDLSRYLTVPSLRTDWEDGASRLTVTYGPTAERRLLSLCFTLGEDGVEIALDNDASCDVQVEGGLRWGDGPQERIMAVCLGRAGADLRCADGPATSAIDNALFDTATDRALELCTPAELRLRYDWSLGAYRFAMATRGKPFQQRLSVRVRERVYENLYRFAYSPMHVNRVFPTPPVGWMTWYAVQFEASEQTILHNAERQRALLGKYGANTIWVDWEWYHRNHGGIETGGTDMFHPDAKAYPSGLGALAERIRELGFVPSLWVSPSCDPGRNEMVDRYPDSVLLQQPEWCGQFFFDPTHPKFLDSVLPAMLGQCMSWGYQAFKWDVLPQMVRLCATEHDRLYASELSPREAMLGMLRKGRECLGDNAYMLYCCALTSHDMGLAAEVFDAARIGNDIFDWSDFITQLIDRLYNYYALHNVELLMDPDNVILRNTFSNPDEAVTRAAIVSLLGMPFTIGDSFDELDDARVEILRRSIPPLPGVRPMDVRRAACDRSELMINVAVERPFGRWNLVDVVNLRDEPAAMTLDLCADLHMDCGEGFYVFDYWNHCCYGVIRDRLPLAMRAHESRILSLHSANGVPQVLSTSRHISQGALELRDVRWDATEGLLRGCSETVAGEPYRIVVTPCADGRKPVGGECEALEGGVYELTFHPTDGGLFQWEVRYE